MAEFSHSFSAVAEAVKNAGFVITDSNVYGIYPELFEGVRPLVLPAGESSKTFAALELTLTDMLRRGLMRDTVAVTVGGGVVGDLGGFAAAVYMRGIRWINVPTTLLSMVDSSVGGKTAVNLASYKNTVGAFHLPERVIICPEFLNTLPRREIRCGLGEALKTACLDAEIYALALPLISEEAEVSSLLPLIKGCVHVKETITTADFKETGERKKLNLGHTVGHALEKTDGFRLSHGEYVALGLKYEARLYRDRMDSGFFDELTEAADRLTCFSEIEIDAEKTADACLMDKKNKSGGKISVMEALAPGKITEGFYAPEDIRRVLK